MGENMIKKDTICKTSGKTCVAIGEKDGHLKLCSKCRVHGCVEGYIEINAKKPLGDWSR